MKFSTFDDLSLYVEQIGSPDNPPVVLVHGIGADGRMWQPQKTSFPAAGFFTIVPDQRGHGQSEVPPDFKIADCARDLRALLDHLNLQRAHFVGVSMGGMIVQQFAAEFPDRVISQVIVDSLSGATRLIERFNAKLAAALLKILPPKLQGSLLTSTYKKMNHAEVGAYFEERLLAMDADWLLAARREVNRFDIFDALPEMHLPTLVLVGDGFGKMAVEMARTTAGQIPGAAFQVLPGGGDPSNLLVPELFDAAVIAFLHQHE